jgi:hypothetical protein
VPGKEPSLLQLVGKELVRTRRRVVVLVAALAVLLAVVVAVPLLNGRNDTGTDASPTKAGAGAASPPAAQSPQQDNPPAAPPSTAPASPSPSPSPSATLTLPDGWHIYRNSNFSVPVPKSWEVSEEGSEVYFREAYHLGGRLLIVDQSRSPKPDPVADWDSQEDVRLGQGQYPNYRRIRIDPVANYWRKAADWEFTYSSGQNHPLHVVKRGFITADDQAYGIHWSTSEEDWKDSLDELDLIFKGFVPARR